MVWFPAMGTIQRFAGAVMRILPGRQRHVASAPSMPGQMRLQYSSIFRNSRWAAWGSAPSQRCRTRNGWVYPVRLPSDHPVVYPQPVSGHRFASKGWGLARPVLPPAVSPHRLPAGGPNHFPAIGSGGPDRTGPCLIGTGPSVRTKSGSPIFWSGFSSKRLILAEKEGSILIRAKGGFSSPVGPHIGKSGPVFGPII